jgi:methyl-accepting chemotaxis protein
MNIGIKAKLLAMLTIMSVFMIIIGAIGLAGFKESNRSLEGVYEDNMMNSNLLAKIDGLMRANRIQILLALQHDPKSEFSVLHDHPIGAHTDLAKKYIEEINQAWAEYYGKQTTKESRDLADTFHHERMTYEKEGLEPAMKALLANDFHEAYRITFDVINPSIKKANQAMDVLMQHETNVAKEAHGKAMARYSLFRNIISISILVALLCGLAIGLPIIRSIGRSSIMLRDVALQLADGDLTARAEVSTHDEMGKIGESFNKIADAFSELVQQVGSCAEGVSFTSEELKKMSDQISSDSDQVAARSVSVATAGEEMAATSNDIASNCTMAVESADKANGTARKGVDIVQQTVQGMARIAAKVQDTARTVENLGVRSTQIGEIIRTIEDIADQTNLLALNAAIEAARAGEQGRGFAVVADEVRALAERTTRATREIGEMIKAIQGETRNAVIAMEEGVAEVGRGTEDAARSGQALQEILDQVNEVTGQINQIATAAEEQTATTNEISGNMIQITDMAKTTAESAQVTNGSVGILLELSQGLREIVGQFRLKL